MLCTFEIKPKEGTPEGRACIIRSEDIRHITDDEAGRTWVRWLIGDEVLHEEVVGTARQNMDRLQQEELVAMARVNAFQQRINQGLPAIPVQRGKAGRNG